MTVDETTLTDLVNLARQRGRISMADLRNALPIDSMTIEDISVVLARLDEAGFDLESDPDLLAPTRHAIARDATTISRPEQTRLPETEPDLKSHQPSLPASTGDPFNKNHSARRPGVAGSAPMLPWVVAFIIILVAVFAAFAF